MKFTLVLFIALAIIGLGQANTLYRNYDYSPRMENNLEDELIDFVILAPVISWFNITREYENKDEEVSNVLQFMSSTEFHDLLRSVEALKEFQALVTYLQNIGFDMTSRIQLFHELIGMEDVAIIKSIIKSQFGVQEIGDGMKGLFKELYDALPLDQIDSLYQEKMKTSKVFADFIAKIESPEMQQITDNLYNNNIYKDFYMKSEEKGLEFQELVKLYVRIYGIILD